MVQIFLDLQNGSQKLQMVECTSIVALKEQVPHDVLCLVNGRLLDQTCALSHYDTVTLLPKLYGGKGGFGSMLRAIGAQIEATTNNDACRDLSGKRLRDVKCEKMLKEWSEKQAHEKDDKKERKRQRLQKVLDGPSRLKSDDNLYITEMRSMSEAVETAIATAIAEDGKYKHVPLPAKRKKCRGDSDSSDSEEEAGSSSSDSPQEPSNTNTQADTQTNIQTGTQSDTEPGTQSDTPTDTHPRDTSPEKGEIKITFVDEVEECSESETSQPDNDPTVVTETTTTEATPNEQEMRCTTTQEKGDPAEQIEDTEIKSPQDTPQNNVPQNNVPPKNVAAQVDWKTFDTADALLGIGADALKDILSDMGLKCGGTPLMRAQRLFSVRDLTKEEIPPTLFATSGKGRKRKGKDVQEFVDR